MKKTLAIVSMAALTLALAGPASANGWWGGSDELNITVSNGGTFVGNDSDTTVNTGGNHAGNFGGGFNMIKTGDAAALTTQENWVNGTSVDVDSCGCFDDVTIGVNNHLTFVGNDSDTTVNTGGNSAHNVGWWHGGLNIVSTGDAFAGTGQFNNVNSTIIRVGGVE